jgi:hypothetical protein
MPYERIGVVGIVWILTASCSRLDCPGHVLGVYASEQLAERSRTMFEWSGEGWGQLTVSSWPVVRWPQLSRVPASSP